MKHKIILWLLAALVFVCCSPKPLQADPAVSQSPVDAAKAALTTLVQSDVSPNDLELLSNRSAAKFGQDFVIVLGIAIGFSDMKGTAPKGSAVKICETRLTHICDKYGVPLKSTGDMAPVVAKENKGREFLTDLVILQHSPEYAKMVKDAGGSISVSKSGMKGYSQNIEDYQFEEVSPTEVKITQTSPQVKHLRAVVEEGKWRIDFDSAGGATSQSDGNSSASTATVDKSAPQGSDLPPVSASLFIRKASGSGWQSGKTKLVYDDMFIWCVHDKPLASRDCSTIDGRKVSVWLGKKGD